MKMATITNCRTIRNIVEGQLVYLVGEGNYKKYPPRSGVIEKIGNKYFYVRVNAGILEKFDLDGGRCVNDYNYGYLVFASEKAYEEYKEAELSYHDIMLYFHDNSFYRNRLSNDAIKRIYEIMKEEGAL